MLKAIAANRCRGVRSPAMWEKIIYWVLGIGVPSGGALALWRAFVRKEEILAYIRAAAQFVNEGCLWSYSRLGSSGLTSMKTERPKNLPEEPQDRLARAKTSVIRLCVHDLAALMEDIENKVTEYEEKGGRLAFALNRMISSQHQERVQRAAAKRFPGACHAASGWCSLLPVMAVSTEEIDKILSKFLPK